MKPAELSDIYEPAEDSPEAMIVKSDLISGGLEPYLYCLLDEQAIREMMNDASLGQRSPDVVEILEEASRL